MEKIYYTIVGYLLFINVLGFYSMWSDKRKAKLGKWRTPEKILITIAVAGGSIGALVGMKKFRHKTKHVKFYMGIPAILLIQIIVCLYFIFNKYM